MVVCVSTKYTVWCEWCVLTCVHGMCVTVCVLACVVCVCVCVVCVCACVVYVLTSQGVLSEEKQYRRKDCKTRSNSP